MLRRVHQCGMSIFSATITSFTESFCEYNCQYVSCFMECDFR
jgi:hypothetical protein